MRTKIPGGEISKEKRMKSFGVTQTVFLVNRVLVPSRFDKNSENDEFAFRPLKTRASLQTPKNDESDQNGGCHSGKGMV